MCHLGCVLSLTNSMIHCNLAALLGIVSCLLYGTIRVKATFAPSDVQLNTLNFNLSLTWSPPEVDLLENEVFLFTVKSDTVGSPHKGNVPHCVNIPETFCSLVPLFPGGTGFRSREWFSVRALSNITNQRQGPVRKTFGGYDIDVSAPVIHNFTISHRNITLWIRGPETPFERNGKKLIMIESGLGNGLNIPPLKFNSSLFESDNPNHKGRNSDLELFDNGRHKLEYTNLHPNTRYVIKLQSQYQWKYSSDVTTFQFRTDPSAPDFGPIISGFEVVSRYCDFRDVNVTWKERQNQRNNGNLTDYEVSFRAIEKPNNDINFQVPASVQSMTVSGLSQWLTYHVTITSINSGGKTEGQMSVLEKDSRKSFTHTYKPDIKKVTQVSPFVGNLTWEPPHLHGQCILGYDIKTSIDGSPGQSFTVDGFNTSWALIELSKAGRYEIDVIPRYNGTLETSGGSKYYYTLPAWKKYGWAILTAVMFAVIVMSSCVIFMARKVICVMADLPDISKSKPMRIASNNHYFSISLKNPPEKEIFHSTRGSKTEIKCKSDCSVDDENDGKMFHTLSSPLMCVPEDITTLHSCDQNAEVQPSKTLEMKDGQANKLETTTIKCQIQDDHTFTAVHLITTSKDVNVDVTSLVDGYVARAPTKKTSLTVTIPKDVGYCPSSVLSAQSSSADSGICSSPLFREPFTDYVPPSPFADSSTEFGTTSCTSDSDEFSYVKADLAVTSGRIQSCSLSSENGSDCPNYHRLDFTQSVDDPQPEGYLPMSPSYPIGTEGLDTTLGQRPCSYFFPPHNKVSPKRFSQT